MHTREGDGGGSSNSSNEKLEGKGCSRRPQVLLVLLLLEMFGFNGVMGYVIHRQLRDRERESRRVKVPSKWTNIRR